MYGYSVPQSSHSSVSNKGQAYQNFHDAISSQAIGYTYPGKKKYLKNQIILIQPQ